MARLFRLWFLLIPVLGLLAANPFNHHMIVMQDEDHFWIKGRASCPEIVEGSVIFGIVASTVVTLIYAGVERIFDRNKRIG